MKTFLLICFDVTKEYILVRERTAPPCVFQTFAHPTSSPACSVRQSGSWSILQTEQGEVGWANVWKRQGSAVCSLTNIYSLDVTIALSLEGSCSHPYYQ